MAIDWDHSDIFGETLTNHQNWVMMKKNNPSSSTCFQFFPKMKSGFCFPRTEKPKSGFTVNQIHSYILGGLLHSKCLNPNHESENMKIGLKFEIHFRR